MLWKIDDQRFANQSKNSIWQNLELFFVIRKMISQTRLRIFQSMFVDLFFIEYARGVDCWNAFEIIVGKFFQLLTIADILMKQTERDEIELQTTFCADDRLIFFEKTLRCVWMKEKLKKKTKEIWLIEPFKCDLSILEWFVEVEFRGEDRRWPENSISRIQKPRKHKDFYSKSKLNPVDYL